MKQIRIQKKQGSVVEVLRDEILSGNIPAGTEMTQTELAESLGVSRMPVREALILLEYQGLVRRLPNNHVRVAELSGDCLNHIFELGTLLETEALEKWADPKELPDVEIEFHRYLYENCPFDFQRKLLETFTETYLYFGIHASAYQSEKGAEQLKMLYASPDGLREYLEEIKQAIIKERGGNKCWV